MVKPADEIMFYYICIPNKLIGDSKPRNNSTIFMEFKERLRLLLDRANVTAYRIWKDTAITKATIGNYLEGKTNPNKSNISVLASYFGVNEAWLLSGTGEMDAVKKLPISEEPFLVTKAGTKYFQMENGRYRMRVPFIPIKAYAKYVDEIRDTDYAEHTFDEFDFIVDQIGHGKYYAFEVKGDSMDDDSKRSISDGDIVLARELAPEYWKEKLRTEDFPNWIIVLDNSVLCKQIVAQDIKMCNITCHSLNPSPEYADFILSLNDVRQLCNIVQRVSNSF